MTERLAHTSIFLNFNSFYHSDFDFKFSHSHILSKILTTPELQCFKVIKLNECGSLVLSNLVWPKKIFVMILIVHLLEFIIIPGLSNNLIDKLGMMNTFADIFAKHQ